MKKILFLLVIALLPLGGCVSMDTGPRQASISLKHTRVPGLPQLSLLLALRENIASSVKLDLADVEILAGERWISLLDSQPLTLSAEKIGNNQRFINRLSVPPGNYKRLRFTFANADHKAKPIIKEQPLIPAMTLHRDDSVCLFLTWDAAITQQGRIGNTPAIRAIVKPIPLTTELAFISCPDIDTIYIVRTDTNRICGSWGVSGHPTYLSVSKSRNELIVLAPEQNKIKIIELSSGRLKDTINLPMIRMPTFMVVGNNDRFAFLLDRQSDYLSKIDLQSGLLVNRVRVIEQPGFLAMADDDTLVLSSELSQKVVFISTDNLQVTQSVSDGGGPKGLLVHDKYLYIAEYKANDVARYNLNTAEIERHPVGLGPTRILSYNDHIYISNDRSNTVSILLPGQTGVARNLRVGVNPAEMAVSSSRNWLYIANKTGLTVLDTTSQRLTTNIDLRTDPQDIAIIQ